MRILVVGGAGYVGSHVNKFLQSQGYETVVFDNLDQGDAATVIKGDFVEGDICSPSDLNALFKTHRFDGVIHLAAHADVGESVLNPEKYYRNNVCGTLNLLSAMHAHDVKTLVFSSSAAIFGTPQSAHINEDHPKSPINPYGKTKLMVEHILRDLRNSYELKYISLRYFNAAGGDPEGQIKAKKKREHNLIPLALLSLKHRTELTVYGRDYPTPDGTCVRDYIHVMDLAAAHLLALEHLSRGGESACYNLGNGDGFSVQEVLDAIEKTTNCKLKIREGGRRPGDPPILVADPKRAIEELGWEQQHATLEEMVSHAWMAFN